MTKLSANKAAKEAGIAKKTLLEAMTSGRLSATKNDKGHWEIEPAELFRVFPKTGAGEGVKTVFHPPEKISENSSLGVEVKMLREQIDSLGDERDRERRQLEDQIEDLRRRLDGSESERIRLNALLTDQREKPAEQPKRRFFGLLAG